MRSTALARTCSLSILLLAPAAAKAQEIVYNSMNPEFSGWWFIHDAAETSSTMEMPGGFENQSQAGELVNLEGAARLLTAVDLRMRRPSTTGTTSATLTLRLFESNDGLPGELLWSSAVPFTINHSVRAVDVSFVPNIIVPDSLIWTFALDDIVGSDAQAVFFGAGFRSGSGEVGTSGPILSQDSTTLDWFANLPPIGGADTLEARFTAVPAPSAAILALLLGGCASRRRR